MKDAWIQSACDRLEPGGDVACAAGFPATDDQGVERADAALAGTAQSGAAGGARSAPGQCSGQHAQHADGPHEDAEGTGAGSDADAAVSNAAGAMIRL